MKLHDYEPKMRKNPVMLIADAVMSAALFAMWIFHEELKLGIYDMIMLSGLVLLIILLTARDHFRKKEFYERSCELKKQRDEMGGDDFSDSNIFFK